MLYRRVLLSLFMAFAVFSVAGCASTYKAADADFTKADAEAKQHEQNKEPYRRPLLGVVKGYWVSTDAVPESKAMRLPPKFNERTQIKAVDIPLSTIMSSHISRYGFGSVYSQSISKDTRVTVDYAGTLVGALSAISSASGLRWELRDNDIYWSDVETRTYPIPMLQGTTSYSSTVGGSLTSTTGGTSAGATGGTSTGGGGSGTSSQTVSRSASGISVWKDLESQVKGMLSKRGTMFVSEATATLTVTDYPNHLASIETFVSVLSKELTRQVMVQVDVIEITLNDRSAHGIDWTAVSGRVGQLGFNLNIANASNVFPSGVSAPTLTATYRAGSTTAATALVKALETQGRVSVKTQPRVVTLNNQQAIIQIGSEVSYVAQASTTTTTSVGSTTALIPGVARSGLMMYLLPRVMPKDDIMMQMSLSINSIKQIRSITSGGSTIEVPEIATKNFQQMTRLKNGQSMVLAGFRQISSEQKGEGVSREAPWIFGSQSATDGRVDTIVLITPYILDDKS